MHAFSAFMLLLRPPLPLFKSKLQIKKITKFNFHLGHNYMLVMIAVMWLVCTIFPAALFGHSWHKLTCELFWAYLAAKHNRVSFSTLHMEVDEARTFNVALPQPNENYLTSQGTIWSTFKACSNFSPNFWQITWTIFCLAWGTLSIVFGSMSLGTVHLNKKDKKILNCNWSPPNIGQ